MAGIGVRQLAAVSSSLHAGAACRNIDARISREKAALIERLFSGEFTGWNDDVGDEGSRDESDGDHDHSEG